MSQNDFNQKPLSCKELLLTFALFILPALIYPPHVSGTEFNQPRFLAIVIVTGLAEAGLIIYLLTNIGGRRLADYKIRPFRLRDILWALLAWLLIFPLLLLAGLAFFFVASSPQSAGAVLPSFRWSFTNYGVLPFALAACIVTGYREELYFRSYLCTEFLRRGMPLLPAVLTAALLFAAGHFYQGLWGAAVSFLLGLYLTGVFRAAKNLHVPALAHGLYNFSVLLFSGLDFFQAINFLCF